MPPKWWCIGGAHDSCAGGPTSISPVDGVGAPASASEPGVEFEFERQSSCEKAVAVGETWSRPSSSPSTSSGGRALNSNDA